MNDGLFYWEMGQPSEQDIIYHNDPFYNECRAYGRIKEGLSGTRKTQDIIVPCHGFLFLSNDDMQLLESKGIDLGARGETGLARAIVKEYIPPGTGHGITNKSLRSTLGKLRRLNRLKIYTQDIRLDNFLGGKLVDFGQAITEPHYRMEHFEKTNPAEARDTRSTDLVMFDEMVAEERFLTSVKALPNQVYRGKLRNYRS